ncbi:MAG: hypothetical protein B7Z55_14490 [Planctomycetales bacterium 12-60-4]|nr:MAG: hypothetical protein B7Z55_14490 [Planctomycetales bacterium 12-60-4]
MLIHASTLQRLSTAPLLLGALLHAGCQLTPAPGLTNCPLPVNEQVHEILQIVPLGTSRDEASQRLTKAGFAGNFSENQSIYYCDIWDKGEGVRWHINVMLLFDEQGKLYATRPDMNGQIDPTPRNNQSATSSAPVIDPFQ